MIELKNISKHFDQKHVLEHIDWTIPKGSIYGLVGPNGAGKSTLLRLIAGVLKADEGQISIKGQLVFDNPLIKRHILFVSDDPFFLGQTNLKEMKAFYQIFYTSFDDGMYQHLVDVFNMDEKAPIQNFSKGMKRQASIILALSVMPEVLLLDEAFDGLDPVMRLTLKRIIADELMNRGMTVIISSHNLRELEDICDRIALLNDTHMTLQDEVENLRDNYHKLQVGYKDADFDDLYKSFNALHFEKRGHIYMLVIKGDASHIKSEIEKTQPLLMEEIPITMEEVFVYEMEDQGYGKHI